MNKTELADLVVSFSHRTDLAQFILDTLIDLAGPRIGRELKSSENEASALMQPTANQFDVPLTFATIRAIEHHQARGPFTLTALDLHSINRIAETGGNPSRYLIAQRKITVRPFAAGDYTLYYYFKPTLPGDFSENSVLTAWPNLYLYATLIELNIFTQDAEQLQINITAFDNEVKQINKSADRGRGDKPAMRRA